MLEAIQKRLEAQSLQLGYARRVDHLTNTYHRVEKGSSDVSALPRGQTFLNETTALVEDWLGEMVGAELGKRRKSSFYNHIIQPAMTAYLNDDAKALANKFYERRYENPMVLIPYFIAKYLTVLMVTGESAATQVGRNVANSIHHAYIDSKKATEEEVVGMVQLLRSFMISDANKAFKEFRYGTTIMFKLSEEYEDLDLPLEWLIGGISGEQAVLKPMVCEPVPHKHLLDDEGGFLTIKSPLLKRPEYDIIRQVDFQENEFISIMNRLQSTKWQINTPLLEWFRSCSYEAVSQHFNTNSSLLRFEHSKECRKMEKRIRALSETNWKNSLKAKDEGVGFKQKEKLARDIANNMDEIERLKLQIEEGIAYVSKVAGWEQTLRDAAVYGEYEAFYHPVFCDNRGRVYTYNTTLSFQGNSLAKSLVQTSHKERMTAEGLESVYELLGGMVDGWSKKKKEKRVAFIVERLESIYAVIEHSDYSFLNEIDEDELMCALALMHEIYHHHHNEEYKTGVLAYIDSTSSAIQVQALAQRCKKAAYLTNLLPNDSDDLPDAYKEVANVCKELTAEIAAQDDDELKAVLQQYLSTTSPDDLIYTEGL